MGWLEELDDHERQVIDKVLSIQVQRSEESLLPVQVREIVPIEKWLDSEYYLGPDVRRIYDFWKERLVEIFKVPDVFNEIIVDGSIGTGKSTLAELALLRKLYELSCYRNVHALFNLMAKAPIVFFYFSLSKAQAELTGFGDIRSFVDSAPYFQTEFPRNNEINSILLWPEHKLMLLHGSSPEHVIGMNLIGAIMDEANFFQVDSDKTVAKQIEFTKAARLYTSIRQRSRSRFMEEGKDRTLSLLVSSSTHQTSFTEDRKARGISDPSVKIITARLWDVKKEGTYSKEMFWVFAGSDRLDPFIVDSTTELNQFLESIEQPKVPIRENPGPYIERLPDSYKCLFTQVPVTFRKDFESDLISALQNIAGLSIAPMGKLFTSRVVYNECVNAGEARGATHPFTKPIITISTGDSIKVSDYLRSGWTPINPNRKRYFHIDQSVSNDSTGLAIVHVADVKEEIESDEEGNPLTVVRKPIIFVDMMLRITPPKAPRKISISKVRDFIFFLRDRFNIDYGKGSYDWFASMESLQVMEEQGIPVEHQSVDRTDEAYLSLVGMIFEERLWTYRYPPFEEELYNLLHDRTRRKVDHPISFSKDVADGLAGAVRNALEDPMVSAAYDENISSFIEANRDDNDDLTIKDLMGEDLRDPKNPYEELPLNWKRIE